MDGRLEGAGGLIEWGVGLDGGLDGEGLVVERDGGLGGRTERGKSSPLQASNHPPFNHPASNALPSNHSPPSLSSELLISFSP